MADVEERAPLLGPSSDILAHTDVYPLIHEIRKDVIQHIGRILSSPESVDRADRILP